MIEYTWKFPQMIVKPQHEDLVNVVIQVDWHLIAKENGHTASSYGRLDLNPPYPLNFVDLNQVTSNVMHSWVEQSLQDLVPIKQSLATQLTHMQAQVDNQIHTLID